MTIKKDILSELATQFLPQMSVVERRAAIESLQKIIDIERFKLATADLDNPLVCHECGSLHIVKRGKDSNGKQRYKCQDCGVSFVLKKDNVFSNSKLAPDVWQRYVACFVDRLSLRECAQRCGVSLKTSWFMRHRILEALWKHMPCFQVRHGCGAQLDETFFRENFKGNHSRSSSFEMPRKSRKRGNENHKRGISKEQICVLTGVNDAGDMFFEIAGRGRLTSDSAFTLLEDKIEQGSIINTDKLSSYAPVLRELGVACHNAYDSKTEHAKLNRINTLHSRIKSFMTGFKGVATRRLEMYLAWFKWEDSFRLSRNAGQTAELALRQLAGGGYETSWRQCKNTPYLFMEYWDRKIAS